MDSRIITVGASAGGVEALSELVAALPADLAAPVLVVLHVAPGLPSHLPQILQRSGNLPAHHAADGQTLRNGHIAVAPPDRHLRVQDGRLQVCQGAKENRQRPSIDVTLRSAAVACGPGAVGAILSGALDDGVAGMESIVRVGGHALVQAPAQARHPYLPQNVIDAVPQAQVLTVAEMAQRIVALVAAPVDTNAALYEEGMAMGRLELQIAGRMGTGRDMNRLGLPSGLTCAECGGELTTVQDSAKLRYRCHTGHAYTVASLFDEQCEQSEGRLWQALRLLRENAQTARLLIERESDADEPVRGERYRLHLRHTEAAIEHLHGLLSSSPWGKMEPML